MMRLAICRAMIRPSQRRQAGLTLVELLVTMSIAFVLTGMILVTWFALQGSFTDQARANEARDVTGQAMSRMVREIRDASAPGSAAVAFAGPDQVSFYTTFNAPGTADSGFGILRVTTFMFEPPGDPVGRIVRYRDVNTPLVWADGQATVIADHVQYDVDAPIFTYWYYNTVGQPVSASSVTGDRLSYIYAVEINLMVDVGSVSHPAPVHLNSIAQLRNARPL